MLLLFPTILISLMGILCLFTNGYETPSLLKNVLNPGDTVVNKTENIPDPHRFYVLVEKDAPEVLVLRNKIRE